MEFLQRQKLLISEEVCDYLYDKKIAIIGLGGVGGAALESIVRCGIKNILIWDNDIIDVTNLNRQIISLQSNIGDKKVDVAKKRALDINPLANITTIDKIYSKDENQILIDFKPDFIIDAIDVVKHKLSLIEFAFFNNIKIISSMGTGNKINAFNYDIMKIEDTAKTPCTLSRVIRRELKKRKVFGIDVICSYSPLYSKRTISNNGRHSPGSISFLPPISGYLMASFVINYFIDKYKKD